MGAGQLLNYVVIVLLPTGGSADCAALHDTPHCIALSWHACSHCTVNTVPCSTYWRGRPSHLYDITIDTELFFRVMAHKDKYMKRGKQKFM